MSFISLLSRLRLFYFPVFLYDSLSSVTFIPCFYLHILPLQRLTSIVSGGFATVQPGNLLSINAVEAYSLEDFSPEAVRSNLAEAQRVASGSGSEEEVAEARIELEVYEALQVNP